MSESRFRLVSLSGAVKIKLGIVEHLISMAIPSGDKRKHLKRAKDFIATGLWDDLRYAALELRLCLEAMTYDKLRSFAKYLTPSFLARTWQPPALLKAMTQFDSSADKSFQLYVGVEAVPGVPAKSEDMRFVGEHKAFGLSWLTKSYHKLGSFLHLQSNTASTDESKLRADLIAIADEIEQAQTGSILGSWIGELVPFECQLCKEQISVSRCYIDSERRAVCLNSKCEAEYIVDVQGDSIGFLLQASDFPCTGCGAEVVIQKRHLANGLKVSCQACKREHIIKCVWHYGATEISGPQVESLSK